MDCSASQVARPKRLGRIAIRRLGFSGEANYAFGALNPEWRITIRPCNSEINYCRCVP
jgi:hypothetical protein